MKIFMIGDVVGNSGCEFLNFNLPNIKKNNNIDIVVANCENASSQNGISFNCLKTVFSSGVDVVTTGNHAFKNYQAYNIFEQYECVLRPANFHSSIPGKGVLNLDLGYTQICVINLIGNVYMPNYNKNPFDTIDEILKENKCKITLVDFHAEATAEKKAMGFYLDGRVSAIVGTHTHIQTADEQILPNKTAYITDLGMTGPTLSVLGVRPDLAIKKQMTGLPVKFELANNMPELCGVIITINELTGQAEHIERLIIT